MGDTKVTTEEEKILPGGPSDKRTKATKYKDGRKVAEGTAEGTDENAAAAAREDMADKAAEDR